MIFTQEQTPQQTFICSEWTIATLEKGVNMFKVNNNAIIQRRSAVFIIFEYISYLLTPFSSVSTVGFEQVNVC